ncbi:MAG: hypothetical protein U7123_01035 [Potamolinea sp.]
MQKTKEQDKSLNSSEQTPSWDSDNSLKFESKSEDIQELFDALENPSLKSQQLVTAITVAVISALAVLAVLQIFIHTIGQQCNSIIYSVNNIGLAGLTGITVGLTTWGLGRISTNQIKHRLDNLQAQFKAVNAKLKAAEQKAEREEKEKENLQTQVSQLIQNIDLNYSNDLTLEAELAPREEEEEGIEPPGTLLDFLDNLHNWFKVTTTPEQLLGSSTLEEVKQRKDELQYRQVWLQALEEETNRELQLLSVICQSSEQEQDR